MSFHTKRKYSKAIVSHKFVRNTASLALLCLIAALPGLAAPATQDTIDLASKTAWSFRTEGTANSKQLPVPAGGWRLNGFPNANAGEYTRSVTIPKLSGSGRQVTLIEFEAVNWEAEVSAGPDKDHLKVAGAHLSAWTPFRIDISRCITPGSSAVIRVRVKDRNFFTDPQGHFTVPAGAEWNDRAARGIIRGVRLRVLPEAYIDSIVVQPDAIQRTFKFKTTLHNASDTAQSVSLAAALSGIGASSKKVAYPTLPSQKLTLAAGETRTITVGPVAWNLGNGMDWWPNIPFRPNYHAKLHELSVALVNAGDISQTVIQRFGFCSVGQKGLTYTINGVPINLRGDSLPEGTIGTDAFGRLPGFLPPSSGNGGWPESVRNYQRLNYNVIRMHQVPCTRYMMDVCDDLGMLVMPETAIRGGGISPENVTEHPEAFVNHLIELIHRDVNHPCVIKWSLENELPAVALPFLRRLYNACMEADGRRPCSIDVFDHLPCPDWPNFAVIDHYTEPPGTINAAGAASRGSTLHGEGEYVWPLGNHLEGPIWFGLETRSMREHSNADLRPYTLIDVWPGVIAGLNPLNFPDPHESPDSLEQGGRSALDFLLPWQDPTLQLIQRSFAPVAAFDTAFDQANLHTNGKGDWPTTSPQLQGGKTATRRVVVYNDDVSDEEVLLEVLPSLKISETNTQPLPDRSFKLHVPLGSHVIVEVPLLVPIVAIPTQLDETIIVWKKGVELYRETAPFVVNPANGARAEVSYAGQDTATQGDWVDAQSQRKFGQDAFLVPIRGGRSIYQASNISVRRATAMLPGDVNDSDIQDDGSDSQIGWSKELSVDDKRLPVSGPGSKVRHPVAFGGAKQSLLFRVDLNDSAPHQVSLYLLDYARGGLPVDVDIYDTRGHRLDSRKIEGNAIDDGVYVKYTVSGSIYISVVSLSTQKVTVSGVFVDPLGAAL